MLEIHEGVQRIVLARADIHVDVKVAWGARVILEVRFLRMRRDRYFHPQADPCTNEGSHWCIAALLDTSC